MNLIATITPNSTVGLPVRLRIVDHDASEEDSVFMNTTVHTKEDAIAWIDQVRDASGQAVTVECTIPDAPRGWTHV